MREIEGTAERDAVSPYGYPGSSDCGSPLYPYASQRTAATGDATIDPATIDFSATGLVSVFLRHQLGPPPLAGATERNVVQIADPALPPKSRPSDRRQVRSNLEAGYELDARPRPGDDARPARRLPRRSTSRRCAAPGPPTHYFFGAAYFDRVLEADRTWLALATAPTGALAAASLAAVSDGFLHYYLSGSADAHLRDSPMKNVVTRLIEHAAELALPLNLGGGLAPGDALEEFKRGFANRQQTWHTSEIVCDRTKYAQLSAGHPRRPFFPAYRAPPAS